MKEQIQQFFDIIFADFQPDSPIAAVLLILGGMLVGSYLMVGGISILYNYLKKRKTEKKYDN